MKMELSSLHEKVSMVVYRDSINIKMESFSWAGNKELAVCSEAHQAKKLWPTYG